MAGLVTEAICEGRAVPEPNPYNTFELGSTRTADSARPGELTSWSSQLAGGTCLIFLGLAGLVAHELLIRSVPASWNRSWVGNAWVYLSLAAVGAGIGLLLKRRHGLIWGVML